MGIKKIINQLEACVENPTTGLPEDVFLFVSRITPLVNVDLLIKNELNHTLLTWRDDDYSAGWHVPGGVVRIKERFAQRINAVAAGELGAKVNFKKKPLAVNEVILPSLTARGHCISFLYGCTLISPPDEKLKYVNGIPKPGEWAWHYKCPDNIISVHEMYRRFI